MNALGTILPTAKSIAAEDRCHNQYLTASDKLARTELVQYERRTFGGEVRYYKTATKYAVITRSLKVAWFETRADGDYAIK